MAYANAYQQYQESQVLTASPAKLLLMTYDGAIRFTRQARIHMLARSYEQKNIAIGRAQRLIVELMSTLRPEEAPEFAAGLARLYEYLNNRLVEANVKDDVSILDEVDERLSELRTAWAQAERQLAGARVEVENYAVLSA